MKENILVEESKDFAVEIIKLFSELRGSKKGMGLGSQLLRSGTSIGANIHEANYASSRADFINKMQIALKECYETDYWLDIFKRTDIISPIQYNNLKERCERIRRILIASIKTAKEKK